MGYVTIENFNQGVDRRRPVYAGPDGSIWSGINGHLSRGGDFEKRKAFIAKYSLQNGTVGLAKTDSGLYVFGAGTTPGWLPAGLNYQQLQNPANAGLAMVELLDWDLFSGKLYVSAKYEDGSIAHFYDGTTVAFWNSVAAATRGTSAKTHKNKLYSAGGSLLQFSIAGDATKWVDNAGAGEVGSGLINMSNQYSGSEALVGISSFQDRMAIFSRRVVQIWSMSSDPKSNQLVQVVNETGAISRKSIRAVGDVDTLYLSDAGIRSLRSREYLNVAGVMDIGMPIDQLVIDTIASNSLTFPMSCPAIVDPAEGRYLCAVGDKIFVFTNFPSSQVQAWTWYEPGFQITDFATLNGRIYARAGNTIYLYGGDDNNTYDQCKVTLRLPYSPLGKPGTAKEVSGVDIAAQGTWGVQLLTNPNDAAEFMDFGTISDVTYDGENTGGIGSYHFLALNMVNEGDGPASVSKVTIYFEGGDSE